MPDVRIGGREAWLRGRLLGLRLAAGDSQVELAYQLGVGRRCIQRWESGEVRMPLSVAIRWAEHYGFALQIVSGREAA